MKLIRGFVLAFLMSGNTSAEPASVKTRDAQPAPNAPTDAKALFDYGLEQGRLGHFETALMAFEEAYRLSPHHVVLFNIGRAAEALGDHARAISAYESFLATGGDKIDETTQIEVNRRLEQLRSALGALSPDPVTSETVSSGSVSSSSGTASAEMVAVDVRCPFPGFALVQDQRLIAKTPFSGTLRLGRKTSLSIEREGYFAIRYDVSDAPSQTFTCQPRFDARSTEPRGVLLFQNVAPGSEILVEGQKVGPRMTLPRGPHLVEISAEGHRGSAQLVEIVPGRTVVLSAKLARIEQPRADSSRTRKDWGIGLLGGGGLSRSLQGSRS